MIKYFCVYFEYDFLYHNQLYETNAILRPGKLLYIFQGCFSEPGLVVKMLFFMSFMDQNIFCTLPSYVTLRLPCHCHSLIRSYMWWSWGKTLRKGRPLSLQCQSSCSHILSSALESEMSLTAVCDILRFCLQRRKVRAWRQVCMCAHVCCIVWSFLCHTEKLVFKNTAVKC